MKVYAIIRKCEDTCYPDYQVFDDKVYSSRKDAKNEIKGLKTEYAAMGVRWYPEEWSIISFELVESTGVKE